ncbi:MAG: excinuclease ABC subunit UvrC [Pseudomonadota bacterium]
MSETPNNNAPALAGPEVIARLVKTLPGAPGVYRMVNKDGDVLYVGKARNLKKRVTAYTRLDKHPVRIQRMIVETTAMEFITTHTEAEALLLEAELIKKLKPRYNILLRDDKSFPYIWVTTDHDFPQVLKHRGNRKGKGRFYGPFASVHAVNSTLAILQKAFMLRNCSDSIFAQRTRPCLQYQIKRCTAPCVQKVSKEEYARQVHLALEFLSGKSRAIQEEFVTEMERASANLDFEEAAKYRDRIRALTSVQTEMGITSGDVGNADVMAVFKDGGTSCIQVFFYRGGQSFGNRAYFPRHEKNADPAEILSAFIGQFYTNKPVPKDIYLNIAPEEREILTEALSNYAKTPVRIHIPKRGKKRQLVDHVEENARQAHKRKLSGTMAQTRLLEETAEMFDLNKTPERIEIYDNSHIQGSHSIGAMVVATSEGFAKNHYRKFNIRDSEITGDDYGMMGEVFRRRFHRAQKEDPDRTKNTWPDLVLIDGGQGQLNIVEQTLNEIGIEDIPLVAVAKGPDRNAGRERFFMPGRAPFTLPVNDPVMYFIQRLRDEAHRFAIGSHRIRRSKETLKSELDSIKGIGGARKKALLAHFGSTREIMQAGISDLTKVEGISEALAQIIYDRFHDG